jgi:hypothetical protein
LPCDKRPSQHRKLPEARAAMKMFDSSVYGENGRRWAM